MSTEVARISKPNMAFLNRRWIYRHVGYGTIIGLIASGLFKVYYIDDWNRKHDEFWRTYNPWEEFERLRQLGMFQSAPPDYILKQREEKQKNKKKK